MDKRIYIFDRKSKEFRLLTESGEPELTCPDGELSGVTDPTEIEEGNGSGSGSKPTETTIEEVLEIASDGPLASLGVGSRLLCPHSAPGLYPGYNLLYMKPNGSILCGLSHIAQWDTRQLGAFRKALCHGDIVTLLGDQGMAWLVRDAATNSYSYRTALPAAPSVDIHLVDSCLAPYCSAEGERPRLRLSVVVGESAVSPEAMEAWISRGDTSGIDTKVRDNLFGEIESSFNQLLDDVRGASLTLSPLRGVATWSGRLPGEPQIIGEAGSTPALLIENWSYISGTLYLDLRLNRTIGRVSLTGSIGAGNALWSDIFPRLEIYLTPGVRRWERIAGAGCAVTSLATVNDNISGSKRAFRLFSLSADEITRAVNGDDGFRLAGSVSAANVSQLVMTLPVPQTGATMVPDYSDHDRLSGAGGCVTDEGSVIFGGNRVLASHAEFGVLYPYRLQVGELPVSALTPSFRRRSSAEGLRTPVYAFSAEGIRLLAGDGHGGYGLSQLVSRDVVTDARLVTTADDYALCLTKRGLVKLTSSKRSLLCSDIPDAVTLLNACDDGAATAGGEGEGGRAATAGGFHLGYHYAGNWLLAGSGNRSLCYDLNSNRWFESDVKSGDTCEWDGGLLSVDEHGHLMSLRGIRREVPVTAGSATRATSGSEADGEDDVSTDGKPGAGVAPVREWVTRALKFGTWWKRKRIVCMSFGEDEMTWILESSEDLKEWREEKRGYGRHTARMHLPLRRFWRIRFLHRLPVAVSATIAI